MSALQHSKTVFLFGSLLLLAGCSALKPIQTEDNVNLERFMGDWYVIAHIPTFLEDEAYNAVESYKLVEPDKVSTTFTFLEDSFEGERETMYPTGYVRPDTGNAVWGMQFIWPFEAEYRILWVNDDYTQTIIGRRARDYVWIMARSPEISEADYQQLVNFVEKVGYDLSQLRKVPQRWPDVAN